MVVADHLKQPTRGYPFPGGRCGPHLAAYLALLRLGVTVPLTVAGSAVGSYPTFSPLPLAEASGGLLSVALSVALRRPGVTWQSALWSSDFPRDDARSPATITSNPVGNITGSVP